MEEILDEIATFVRIDAQHKEFWQARGQVMTHGFSADSGSQAMRYVATDAYESKRREKARARDRKERELQMQSAVGIWRGPDMF